MGDERAFDPAGLTSARFSAWRGSRLAERLRHVLWATGIAFAMFVVMLLYPVDQFAWLLQSKIANHQPSGDIVFVDADSELSEPSADYRRLQLADALSELDRQGVGKVYLDLALDTSTDRQIDRRLARAIADLGPRLTLVDRIVIDTKGDRTLRKTSEEIGGSAARVISDQTDRSFFDLSWSYRFNHEIDGTTARSFGAALAGVANPSHTEFPVDYGFPDTAITVVRVSDVLSTTHSPRQPSTDLSGKTVVVGHGSSTPASQHAIPGRRDAPISYVDIYAAESLKANRIGFISGDRAILFVALFLVLLLLIASSKKQRWFGYAAGVLLIPVSIITGAKLGIRVEIAHAIAALSFFAIFRSRSRWKRRVELFNQETGLPNLRALEARLTRDRVGSGHIVVAKIQNFERVLKTLQNRHKRDYVLKLVDRLRATDPELTIYSEGHYLAWHSPNDKTDALVDHLQGLRAIFAAPVYVAGFSVDVGITFGVAAVEGDPEGRFPAALAASEETSEAIQPISVAESVTETDLLWDISLRARIDEAMEASEIYCVYQPKIELRTYEVTGVEALVRWHDPARGFISPVHFIQQCEKAGRMEHLTRYVLQSACSAGQLLHFRGRKLSMAVNISATMLNDMRIVGIVRNVLQATRFDSSYLVLEITETARIADHANAACIVRELQALGIKISMDDFGVGAANFEAFYELPFDEIKIDRLFVSAIGNDPKARAIVASTASMGREARITVVAEGLEDPKDIELLKAIGCEQVQGFAFSRPLSLPSLLEFEGVGEAKSTANVV